MQQSSKYSIFLRLFFLVGFVIFSSYLVTQAWVQKKEQIPEKQLLTYSTTMTLQKFGEVNNLSKQILKDVFDLQSTEVLEKTLDQFPFNEDELTTKVDKVRAIEAEHGSKDWQKILLKFVTWFFFMGFAFSMLRKKKLTPNKRKGLYLLALVIFGVILGADPSPMGTVKDAIVLFAAKGVIFPPRLIALTVFLLTVFLANKFICSWGCQVGTLQDLIFRLNRNKTDRKGIIKQFKLPFVVTNTIRVVFFGVFILVAMVWALDIYEFIDPFKIYKPAVITVLGWGFLGLILLASLFVYRPWCSMFCPFGLVGWLVEKLAVFKIKVDYNTCTACESCSKACPSTVMGAILKQDKVIPDCFSCGVCVETCPTGSITFASGKRAKPPLEKFQAEIKEKVVS